MLVNLKVDGPSLIKTLFLFTMLFFFFTLAFSFNTKADLPSEDTIRTNRSLAEDGSLNQKAITQIFLNLAFVKTVWGDNTTAALLQNPNDGLSFDNRFIHRKYATLSNEQLGNLDANIPWAREYITRVNGVPPFPAINKWDTNISIGFGWPTFLVNLNFPTSPLNAQVPSDVLEYVKEAATSLSSMVGHEVKVYTPSNETSKEHGKLRIVFLDDMRNSRSHFKLDRAVSTLPFDDNRNNFTHGIEPAFIGAVEFTHESRSQVEGYILPSPSGSIERAVCYIWSGHSASMRKSLVLECMLRSMGLPGYSYANMSGLLGNWNAVNEAISKKTSLDGFPPSEKLSQNHQESHAPIDVAADITNLDKLFVRILYRSNIKAGDSYNTALQKVQKFSLGEIK